MPQTPDESPTPCDIGEELAFDGIGFFGLGAGILEPAVVAEEQGCQNAQQCTCCCGGDEAVAELTADGGQLAIICVGYKCGDLFAGDVHDRNKLNGVGVAVYVDDPADMVPGRELGCQPLGRTFFSNQFFQRVGPVSQQGEVPAGCQILSRFIV